MVALTVLQLATLSVSADSTNTANQAKGNDTNVTAIQSLDKATSEQLAKAVGLDGSTKLVKTSKVQRGDKVTFDNFFLVGNQDNIKSLSLVDPLNKNFNYETAQVLLMQPTQSDSKASEGTSAKANSEAKNDDSSQKVDEKSDSTDSTSKATSESSKDSSADKSSKAEDTKTTATDDLAGYKAVDVSKTGKFTFDKETHTLNWKGDKPGDSFGQLLDLRVTVTVNKDTDLNEIPNQSYMLKNDKKTDSDTVTVTVDAKATPKAETPTPKEANPSTPTNTKYAKVASPQGSLPQTMQKVAKQYWPLLVASLVGLIGGLTYWFKVLKNKGVNAKHEK